MNSAIEFPYDPLADCEHRRVVPIEITQDSETVREWRCHECACEFRPVSSSFTEPKK